MPALTVLRALLAWWVVAFHIAPLAPFRFDQRSPLLFSGMLCVDGFFILSGFVLFSVYPVLLRRGRPDLLGRFYVARFARLYPLHVAVLCAFVALVLGCRVAHVSMSSLSAFTPRALAVQVFLLNGSLFPDVTGWNYPSWSVGAEVVAYLAAPVLFLLLGRLRPRQALLLALLLGTLLVALCSADMLLAAHRAVPRVLLEFSFGALSCRLVQRFRLQLLAARAPALAATFVLLAVAAAAGLHGAFVACLAALIALLSLRNELYRGLAGQAERLGLHLGETSYGVYLCHALVLTLWAGATTRLHLPVLHHPLPAALLLAATIQGMASALYWLVEIPMRNRIRAAWHIGVARQPAGPAWIHASGAEQGASLGLATESGGR